MNESVPTDDLPPSPSPSSSSLRQLLTTLPGWQAARQGRALSRVVTGLDDEAGEHQRFQEALLALEGCRAAGLALEMRLEPGRLALRLWQPDVAAVSEEAARLARAIVRAGLSEGIPVEADHEP
jgi:hypothetical protein